MKSGDLINRQVVKDKYRERLINSLKDDDRGIDLSKYAEEPYKAFCEFIDSIPSINPQEQRVGRWIKGYTFPDGVYWKCDKCNELIKVKIPMHYCNNCGCCMVEP